MVITKYRLGFICTGAGIDRSNVVPDNGDVAVLLPKDPDKSAGLGALEVRAQKDIYTDILIDRRE